MQSRVGPAFRSRSRSACVTVRQGMPSGGLNLNVHFHREWKEGGGPGVGEGSY
jgi:hypothetical protein